MPRLLRACVLAGGASRRMGADKALLPHPRGGTWIDNTVAMARALDLQVLVLSGHPRHREHLASRFPDLSVLPEPWPPAGPLQAFAAVFSARVDEAWLVLPIDLPYLTSPALETLLVAWREQEHAALVAHDGERQQPLLGIYPGMAGSHAALERQLGRGCHRWHDWLDLIPHRSFFLPPEQLLNANHPADLAALTDGEF
ncbi:molybdenum cofactor guanylyltransferase [Synechococcus sp. HK01-R]|nr:molybdenum cofactor guanylyltransferase [Synechococcus sp. HK01-R]QNG27633.1 molybdenum cofactor guanylyltransferase [Synechococcus sp. HK01-R]